MKVCKGNWKVPKGKNKNISLKTAKRKAGKLLTAAINEIALEETELIKNKDGEDVMVSKVYALAQLIWKSSLGYKKITLEGVTAEEITFPPSLAHQNILLDRMIGKVSDDKSTKKEEKGKLADKVSEEAIKRINNIGGVGGKK